MTKETKKGTCRKNYFTTNIMVTHGMLVCYGGLGQPTCEYLDECRAENGLKKWRGKRIQ